MERAEARLKRSVRLMLAFRATTLAGMECKLRVLALGLSPAVMRSVEADLGAMGLLGGQSGAL